ncbi:MAG: NADH-quinone oxidoreductase subunit L, partial [Pseudomonadota bacterium]
SLALIGFPFFSGFYSKDAIIEAVHHAERAGSGYAYGMLLIGVFVTALYSFRMFFLVFHGEGPRDEHAKGHLHESPAVVWVPLVLLAIPSVVIGYFTVGPMLFGDWFGDSLFVKAEHDPLHAIGEHFHGAFAFALHGLMAPPFYLAMGGLFAAWWFFMKKPEWAFDIKVRLDWLHRILDKKYFFDEAYLFLFGGGSRLLGKVFWRGGDQFLIDGVAVNGSAHGVGRIAAVVRRVQTGYLYHYAIAIILGLLGLVAWFVVR